MSDAQSAPSKVKRERSPSFPFIPLKTAIARLTAFDEYSKRHPVPAKHVGQAWGMKGYTSQAQQTLAALKSFGLLIYEGSAASLTASLSDDGRTYLRSQQETTKKEILKRVALVPKALAKHFATWGTDRPHDAICLDELVLKEGYTDAAAKLFLTVYDETIAFAGLVDSDKVASAVDEANEGEEADDKLPSTVKAGDYVQWTSQGRDQFSPVRKVQKVTDDGFAFVQGSPGGIAMAELTVVDAPKPPAGIPPAPSNSAYKADNDETRADINVYQTGDRLQITADVDMDGLQKLKELLTRYEGILEIVTGKKANPTQ